MLQGLQIESNILRYLIQVLLFPLISTLTYTIQTYYQYFISLYFISFSWNLELVSMVKPKSVGALGSLLPLLCALKGVARSPRNTACAPSIKKFKKLFLNIFFYDLVNPYKSHIIYKYFFLKKFQNNFMN